MATKGHPPRFVVEILASPKTMTKAEFVAAVKEGLESYKDRIRPDLQRLEMAILSGADDVPDLDDALISELGDGLEWAYVDLPDWSEYQKNPGGTTPAAVYQYMRKYPHPKTKMDVAKALGLSLTRMERAFAWLRKRRVVIPVGFRIDEEMAAEVGVSGYKARVYSIRQEVIKSSKQQEEELVFA